jgi:hypothetical protein
MKPFALAVSNVGATEKPLVNIPFPKVSRATIKVRSLGTNTVIDIGDFSAQEFRLTAVNDSFTIVDVPGGFDLQSVWIGGDNAANDGIVEVFGLVIQ